MTVQAEESVDRRRPGRLPRGPRSVQLGETLREFAPFIPAAALIGLWMVWIPASGGYFPNAWDPSALGAVALLVVVMVAGGRVLPSAPAARVALLSFAGLVALNYLSVLWAGSPGDAVDASNKLLLYLAVAWTFSVLPWTPKWMTAALCAWALGVAAFCAVGLVQATSASNLDPFFVEFRWAIPTQYPNGAAALAVMGMWPALIFSARREVPAWLRVCLLPLATFLAEFALLPQSRAAVLGVVVTLALVLVVATDRLRLLTRMAVVSGGLAVTAPRTVAVDKAINAGRHVGPVLSHAAAGMLLTSLAALFVGVLFALVDRRWSWEGISSRQGRRFGRRGRLALVAALLIAVGTGGVIVAPAVSHLVKTVVKNGRTDASGGSTHLFSTTPEERFDYSRVGLRLFSDQPLLGIGAGNFGRRYDALRRFPKHSQYTHDVGLRALSETGIIGFGVFVAIVVALAVGLVRARRELRGLGGACAVAALAVAAYFLVHASVDWLDEIPALAAPALAFSLGAIAMRARDPEPRSNRWRSPFTAPKHRPGASKAGRIAAGIAAAGMLAAAVIALVFPYLETRYVERALATFRSRPAGAYSDLSRAASLNPLSAAPITSEGTVALELRNFARARSSFERSLRKVDDWYPRLELALLDAHAGHFGSAAMELRIASSLDARDPILVDAKTLIDERKRVDPVRFDQELVQGAPGGLFTPQGIKK